MDILKNIVLTDNIGLQMVHFSKGQRYVKTNRPRFGISFCYSGQITYSMGGKTYVSDPKHAVILPKGGTYSLYGDEDGVFPLLNFDCEHFPCDTITVLPLVNPEACLRDFEKMQSLILFSDNRLQVFSAFYELIDKLYREQLPQQNLLRPAIQYIEKHLGDADISNDQLAKEVGISEIYFRRLFSQQYGVTPRQYILNVRIQKAKQLLTSRNCNIAELAEECGFTNVYHFCRTFKKRTGMTPTQYSRANFDVGI